MVHVLLVEDNPADAELVHEELEGDELAHMGDSIRIASVGTLREALEVLPGPPFDVIVSDVGLPDACGAEGVPRLRAAAPSTPIVALTGNHDPRLRSELVDAGAVDVLLKGSLSPGALLLLVHSTALRVRAERSRLEIDSLIAAVPDAIVVGDARGEPVYVSPAAETLLAQAPDLSQMLPDVFSAAMGSARRIQVGRDRARRDLEVRVAPVSWRGREARIAVIRDVSERARMEEQLMLSDRMATVGTLAAGVAHEINNPLAALLGFVEFARREAAALAAGAERDAAVAAVGHLRDAAEAGERIREIVKDLKVLSRTEERRIEPVDVHAVLESSIRVAWNEIRHRARLVKIYDATPWVRANDSRLGQVFLNLLVNAAQATPVGHTGTHEIRITTRSDAESVEVEIRDTGCGISADDLERVFKPFFTTKPRGVGTGLGLAICQRIVTELSGRIDVESTVGAGTTFRVRLPACAPPAGAGTASADSAVGTACCGRLLVVDDEEAIGRLVRQLFHGQHHVEWVGDGASAVERLASGERFDVVLCDLMMPGVTGMQVYETLRQRAPGVIQRFVFMSGGVFDAGVREFLERTTNTTIEKPFDLAGLESLVAQRLEGGRR